MYLFQKTFLLISITSIFLNSSYSQDCDCDFTLNSEAGKVDGKEMEFSPGDVICIQSGTYGSFLWENIEGSEENPIIVKNCGGQVIIDSKGDYAWKWRSSKYFKILGNSESDVQYGFKVSTANSFFFSMEYFTTNFEIAHVEVVGNGSAEEDGYSGFAGIGIKTSPYVDCEFFKEKDAWTMEDISIHDNYIHKTGGEGIYAGHGFHQGRQESNCPDGVITYPHAIHNLHIYNNRIEDVGFDGIQIKNSTKNALVHDNTIFNYGVHNHAAHNEGMLIGESTEGKFYNNRVEKGTGHGMQINAYGNSAFYNNVIIGAGNNGVYLNNQSAAFENKEGTFKFFHNTFVNMGTNAFESFTPQDIVLRNNLFVNYEGEKHRGKKLTDVQGDIYADDISSIGFTDPESNDYSLLESSIAVNAGVEVLDVGFDITNTSRNDGKNDVGAYEYSPHSNIVLNTSFEIKVFPNPASDHLNIVIQEGQNLSYEINSISGQTVQSGKLSGNDLIELNGIASGIYILKINHSKVSMLNKIIKY